MRKSYSIVICIMIVLLAAIPSIAQAKEIVTFWYGATQNERAAYDQLISSFNRTHPNIEVRGMLVPQQYVERKLILSVAGGVPPDVVRFYTHLGGEMMSRGGLEPLDKLAIRDGFDLSDFYPIGIEQNTYHGRLYGVPWVLSPNMLFYNKKLFREAGLDPNKPPVNWEDLQDYAAKLTVRGSDGSIERVGYADFMNNPANFHLYLWQNGGNPLSPDMQHIAFTSPEGVATLTWMRNFIVKEVGQKKPGMSDEAVEAKAVQDLQTFQSSFVGATQDSFGLEKVAMRVDSPFRIPDIKKYFPNLDFGIAPAPYNKAPAFEVVGNALVIPRGSKHRDAAWEFIKYATSKAEMLAVTNFQGKFGGRIPARKSAAKDPALYGNPVVKPFVDMIGTGSGRTTPIAPGYREVSDTLSRNIEHALKGELSPEAALRQSAAKGQEILTEANDDPNKYALVPWKTVGVVSLVILLLAAGIGYWQVSKHTNGSRKARKDALNFYLFISPWLIGFVVLTFGAMVASLVFSFSRWDILNPARFIGLGNYSKLVLHDPRFIKALYNTIYYAFFTIPLSMIGGLAISVLLNQKLKGIQVFRTIYYLPAVVSGVATVILWQWLFNPASGLINKFLTLVHIDKLLARVGLDITGGFLMNPQLAKPAFIIMGLWAIGGSMIIYLAGLQGVPEELYEAARIDGANGWQRFRNVTLPLLTPTIFYQLIIGTLAAFQFFTPAYIMTGGTGNPNDSTLFYSLYLFNNAFEYIKMGYASAMAWILFTIVLLVTVIQMKTSKRWVYYEGKAEE